MNSPTAHPDSHHGRNLPSPDVALGNLPVKRTGEESIPQTLEPIHHVFGNAVSVVAGGFLPARSPFGFDFGQDGIARMVIPPKHSTLAGRNRCLGFPLGDGSMGSFGVVGVIRRDLTDRTVDLGQQVREDFAVVPVGRRHFNPNDVFGRLIDGQVNLAPGAAFADTVLANLPLAFPEYLQPCSVDHDMRGACSRTTGHLDFQRRRPARQIPPVAAKTRIDDSPAKAKYRYPVKNWVEYDRALVNRGNLTLWFDEDSVNKIWTPPRPVGRGKPGTCSMVAIQTCLTLKPLFRLPYRATEGLLKSLIRLCALDLPVPDHTNRLSLQNPAAGRCMTLYCTNACHNRNDIYWEVINN